MKLLPWLALMVLTGWAGCKKSSTEPPDDGPTVVSTLVMTGGAGPVWMPDGDRFLFTPHEEADSLGIYLGSLEGEPILPVWVESHNHDYVPCPGGQQVAFSTPGPEGGVWVADLASGTDSLWLPGGRRPTWLADGTLLVAEDAESRIVRIDLGTGESQVVVEEGLNPVGSPTGLLVAYLGRYGADYAHRLYVIALSQGSIPVELATGVGLDPVWDPDSHSLYVSQVAGGTLSRVIGVDLFDPGEVQVLISAATFPSVGNGGAYLLAVDLVEDREAGLLRRDMASGATTRLLDEGRYPAADLHANRALVEKDDGIYLVEW